MYLTFHKLSHRHTFQDTSQQLASKPWGRMWAVTSSSLLLKVSLDKDLLRSCVRINDFDVALERKKNKKRLYAELFFIVSYDAKRFRINPNSTAKTTSK